MRFRGENPVYKYGNFDQSYDQSYDDTGCATYSGVIMKSSLILGIVAIIALYSAYTLNITELGFSVIGTLLASAIIAMIAVVATRKLPQFGIVTSIVYAVCEGVFLGIVSGIVAYFYGGELVQMALVGTFGVLAGMLFLYATGIIRVGSFFRRFMYSMVLGLLVASIALFIMSFTGAMFFYDFYVVIVLISVVISSLYLLVDFDSITRLVQSSAPKEFEWSLAIGLATTIVWVYINLLRLLVIIAGRRR